MKFKFYLLILILFFNFTVFSHEINIEDKKIEEIIKLRMKNMSVINALSKKIYKDLNSGDFMILKNNTSELKDNIYEFKQLFPKGSIGGKAKELIWEDKKLFNEYIEAFLRDTDLMIQDIEDQNLISLKNNFNLMTSNCGTCHRKFKSK